MSLVQCPSCGGRVSHLAAACPRCGYPIAVPPPPPKSSSSTGVVIALVVAAVALGAIVVVGAMAAIAIPRFARASDRARESVAWTELEKIHALQQEHLAATGAFTANLTDPDAEGYLAGWSGTLSPDYHYSVSLAAGDGLCVEAVPEPHMGAHMRVLSMDAAGTQYRGASCTGEVRYGPRTFPIKDPVESAAPVDGSADSSADWAPAAPADGAADAPAEEEASGKSRITSEGVYDPAAGTKPTWAENP